MGKNLDFIEHFKEYVDKNKLIKAGDKLIVGFSGGADSTALLSALWHLRSQKSFSLIAAHINYNLRGEDSQEDEEFVKNFCFKRNISLVVKNVKIDSKSNLENQAREIRFQYFNKIKKQYKFKKIALGHNKKDQAETVLFRLFRGSGYTGIQGISPIVGNVIHPLLSFSREEIEKFLKSENIKWREDLSNQENEFSRNKIRNVLIPWLEENMNIDVIDKLYNASHIFTQTDEILEKLARRRYLKVKIKNTAHAYNLDIKKLRKIKPVLRFYVYKYIYGRLNNDEKDFYHTHFEEIEDILDTEGSKQLDLPNNVFIFKKYDELIFTDKDITNNVDVENSKKITHLRNRVTFEDYRIIMKKLKKLPRKRNVFEDKNTVYIDFDKMSFPLIIRHRQPGDNFFPLGMKHPKKLKDFFIDEKVPKFDRDNLLLFCDEEKILWVAGHRIDDRVATSSDTKNILKIRIEKKSKKKLRAAERISK